MTSLHARPLSPRMPLDAWIRQAAHVTLERTTIELSVLRTVESDEPMCSPGAARPGSHDKTGCASHASW